VPDGGRLLRRDQVVDGAVYHRSQSTARWGFMEHADVSRSPRVLPELHLQRPGCELTHYQGIGKGAIVQGVRVDWPEVRGMAVQVVAPPGHSVGSSSGRRARRRSAHLAGLREHRGSVLRRRAGGREGPASPPSRARRPARASSAFAKPLSAAGVSRCLLRRVARSSGPRRRRRWLQRYVVPKGS